MKLMQTNKGEFGYLKRERKSAGSSLLPFLWRTHIYFYQHVDLPWHKGTHLDHHCPGGLPSKAARLVDVIMVMLDL